MKVDLLAFRNRPAAATLHAQILVTYASAESRAWHVLETVPDTMRCWAIHGVQSEEERKGLEQMVERFPAAKLVQLLDVVHDLASPETFDPGPVQLAIDVSCMPRPVMAEVFSTLFALAESRDLTVTVFYALAAFTEPPQHLPPNEEIRPVHPRFSGWPSDVASSTALLIGLGYEQHKAEGASEYFDPSELWVFMPRSPLPAYDDAVVANNKELIERARRSGNLIDYPVADPERTFGELVRIAASTRQRATPLILPFGPKVFFAISLVVSLLYEDVGVWLITGDLALATTNHVPSGTLISFEVSLRPTPIEG